MFTTNFYETDVKYRDAARVSNLAGWASSNVVGISCPPEARTHPAHPIAYDSDSLHRLMNLSILSSKVNHTSVKNRDAIVVPRLIK